MIVILTIIHIFVSFVLILVVLLQTGKRADLAGAFGGGGSQTALGTRGAATFLTKMTTASAIIFMLTCLSLAILSARQKGQESVLDKANVKQEVPVQSAPVVPFSPSGVPQTGAAQTGDKTGQGTQQAPVSQTGTEQEKESSPESKQAP